MSTLYQIILTIFFATLRANILNIIKKNLNNDEIQDLIAGSDTTIKSKAFNDANISAHYGIISTQNKISSQ